MSAKHRPSAEDVANRIEAMLQEMARFRTPEFLDVGITMAQAKVLHVVVASGEIHMSELVHTLGVSLSTVSGLVEKPKAPACTASATICRMAAISAWFAGSSASARSPMT